VIDARAATVADRFEGLAQVTGERASGGDGVVPPHIRHQDKFDIEADGELLGTTRVGPS
jgi:hypothetical protein